MAATAPRRKRSRRVRPNKNELQRLLAPTSTTKERVEGILSIGMPASDLAELTETTESSVRHWLSGETEPRPEPAVALDYTRAAVKALVDAGIEPERIHRWMMSIDPERFDSERPFDVLKAAPMRVLTAALEIGLEAGVAA